MKCKTFFGVKRRRGRPKSKDPKSKGILIRLTLTDHEFVRVSAKRAGMTMSHWVRALIMPHCNGTGRIE